MQNLKLSIATIYSEISLACVQTSWDRSCFLKMYGLRITESTERLDARVLRESIVPSAAQSRAVSRGGYVVHDCVLANLEYLQGWRSPSFSKQPDKVLSLAFHGEEEEESRRNAAIQQV